MIRLRRIMCLAAVVSFAVRVSAQQPATDLDAFTQQLPQARVTVDNGLVSQVYGRALSTGRTPAESADAFLNQNAAALGIDPSRLDAAGAFDLMDGRFRLFTYQQRINGIDVHDRWVKLLVRRDAANSLVLVNSSAVPPSMTVALPRTPRADEAVAIAAARQNEPSATQFTRPYLVYLAPDAGAPVLAWRLFGDNGQPTAFDRWEFFVDASTGELTEKRPGLYHADITGTVNGFQSPVPFPDQANNPPAALPVFGARVRAIGGGTTYVGVNGSFVLPNGGASPVDVVVDLVGQWATVSNAAGGGTVTATQNVTPPGPVNFVLNPTPTQQLTAQVNAMTRITVVHDFVKSLNPGFTGFDLSMPTSVNQNDTCNAFYTPGSPSLNFFLSGGGCPNSAYAGVVYHEYGHFVVDFSPGGPDNGDYHEGMSDVVSTLLQNDPCLGHDFFGQGSGCLRNVETSDRQFPCSGSGHFCGQVIAGAFWDMRTELIATEGPAAGLQLARDFYIGQIFSGNHQIAPSVVTDVLTLDDDDADLANGTPHYDEICTGFAAHSLACPPLMLFTFDYPSGRPALSSPGGGTTFPVDITTLNATPDPSSATLNHRIGTTGLFAADSLTHLGGDSYQVGLPAAPCGESIQYYLSADGQTGGTSADPPTAPTVFFQALSAGSATYAADLDFETAVGWTVANVGLTDGAWNRGIPVGGGVRGDPPTDYDGSGQCFLTDNVSGNSDVDGGTTTLQSPDFDISAMTDPDVVYARWYSNSAGDSPFTDVFNIDVSGNGGGSWVPLEAVGPAGAEVSGGWFVKTFRIADFVPLTTQFRIRFAASDLGAGSIVEAAIDQFEIRDITCSSCIDGQLNQGETRIDCGGPCPPCDCLDDIDCADAQFCNGDETCDPFGMCQPGSDPCNGFACDDDLDECLPCMIFAYGDVNHDQNIDIFDILCVLDGFAGVFADCTADAVDLAPCAGDATIDVFDVLAVLGAFAADPTQCADPCVTPPFEPGDSPPVSRAASRP
ncbi:MAG: hypothetical protein HOP29_02580 [Phycisphaerales bacterium]|nr:hypothetical protein [Phycisphaerales bacterium]